MSSAPWLYERCLQNRVDYMVTGHLHMPGSLRCGSTVFYLCPLNISTFDPNRNATYVATGAILEFNKGAYAVREIAVKPQ